MAMQATMLYGGILGLFLTLLSFNVMYHWVRVTGTGQETDQAHHRAERILSNFVEYAPLTLFLIYLLEQHGTPSLFIHLLGISLVLSRFLHAFAANPFKGAALMRFAGAQLGFLTIMVAGLANIYLYAFERL